MPNAVEREAPTIAMTAACGGPAPRRVLAVNPSGLCSGAEIALLRVLRAAQRAGWRVDVATPDGPLAERVAREALPRTRLPELRFSKLPKPLSLATAATRSLRAASVLRHAASEADVVLVNGWHALPAVRLARVPCAVVWFVHDVLRRRDQQAVVKGCAPVVTVAVAPSRAGADPLRAVGMDVRIVPNGTPWPIEPAPAEPPDPPVIGVSGPLTGWKGQDVLLEAVARLRRRDPVVELMGGTFPGDRAYVRRLAQRAAEPDLAGRVRLLGHVDDPVERLRGWSVAVSASIEPETAPLNVLEAMSVGVPMVATDHGGTPEVLGEAGLLVPPRDADALAVALDSLLGDTDLRQRCARAGPKLIAAGLTLDAQGQAFVRVLEAVTQRAPVG
ncbi:MAG: glycosyltransferase family 4 protein [Acidimicrobiia bacterium]